MKKLRALLLPVAMFFASAYSDSIPWTCNRDETFELQDGVALYLAYWVTGEDASFTLRCEGFKIWCSTDRVYRKEESFELSDPNKWNVITITLSLGFSKGLSMDPFGTFDVLNNGAIKNKKIRITSEKKIYWQKCDSYNSCVTETQKCPSSEPEPQSQTCPTGAPEEITTSTIVNSVTELEPKTLVPFFDLKTIVLLIVCVLLTLIIIGLVIYIIQLKKALFKESESSEEPQIIYNDTKNLPRDQEDHWSENSIYGAVINKTTSQEQ